MTASKEKVAPRLGVLIIGRKRPGFDQEWNAIIRRQAIAAFNKLGFDCVGADAPVVDDETIDVALKQINAAACDALVILQPSLGNGQLALAVAQRWPHAVILWATPERPTGEHVSSCSLVAQHLWASIFRQSKHAFELVYGGPESDTTRRELSSAIAVARAAAQINRATLGLVGGHAPGFIAMQADSSLLKRHLGVQLKSLSLPQFFDRVRAIGDAAVSDDLARLRARALPMKPGVSTDDLPLSSRLYLAMRDLIAEERLDALAIQCWPEVQSTFQWPYLAMSRLADDGIAIAMEGDTDGALTCLAARELGAGVGFITDWLEHDDDTIHFWHPGTAPLSMCDSPSLATHFNIAKPLVVDGPLRSGAEITIARVWRCDDRYYATAFEGRTIAPPRPLSGNQAAAHIDGGQLRRRFDDLCHAGFPHHPVLFYGRHADSFRRLARSLDLTWISAEAH